MSQPGCNVLVNVCFDWKSSVSFSSSSKDDHWLNDPCDDNPSTLPTQLLAPTIQPYNSNSTGNSGYPISYTGQSLFLNESLHENSMIIS